MEQYSLANTDLTVSRIAYGCMGLAAFDAQPLTAVEQRNAIEVVMAALDVGINLFDHADIYAYGKAEQAFAAVWDEVDREDVVIQSKCGIILPGDPQFDGLGRYDFSYDHIVGSVEGSLSRLQTDYLDILLLHRPDPLVEPEEVARAWDHLHQAGKVRYLGVSNHSASQIQLLQTYLDQPLVVNQLELSLRHHHLIETGIRVNQEGGSSAMADGLLDFCRLREIRVQAWAPVAGGLYFNPPADAPKDVRATADLVARLAADKGTTVEAIMLAWLLRHPAGIQPIIGTSKAERVRASAAADDVRLSRSEWYDLLTAARGAAVP